MWFLCECELKVTQRKFLIQAARFKICIKKIATANVRDKWTGIFERRSFSYSRGVISPAVRYIGFGSWLNVKDGRRWRLRRRLSSWTTATTFSLDLFICCRYVLYICSFCLEITCQLFRFGSIRHFHNCRSARIPCQMRKTSCSTPIDISSLFAKECLPFLKKKLYGPMSKPDPPYQQQQLAGAHPPSSAAASYLFLSSFNYL